MMKLFRKQIILSGAAVIILATLISISYTLLRQKVIASKIQKDRDSLRSIAAALESYRVDRHVYPSELNLLTRVPDLRLEGDALVEKGPYISQLPCSSFENKLYPGYHLNNEFWLIWMPGPDKDFDLIRDNDFREAFDRFFVNEDWRKKSVSSPWLGDRIYDPTNGISSSGDLLRSNFYYGGGGSRI